jgi:hypothetical protein
MQPSQKVRTLIVLMGQQISFLLHASIQTIVHVPKHFSPMRLVSSFNKVQLNECQ